MMHCNRRRAWLATAVLLCGACDAVEPGTQGELGEGFFTYECLSDQDVGCQGFPPGEAEIPDAVAVESKFDVEFGSAPANIEAGSESLVKVLDVGFKALTPGRVAIMARATEDGRIIDFVHVNLVVPAAIELTGEGMGPEIRMQDGDMWEWVASPVTEDGTRLAGTLVAEWTTSDDGVVQVSEGLPTHVSTLYAMGPGTATITIRAGAITRAVEVTVEP